MESSPNHNVVPFKQPRRNQAELAILAIDNGLEEAASITIEQSLQRAIERGDMSIKEAEDCLEAYRRTFHGPDDAA